MRVRPGAKLYIRQWSNSLILDLAGKACRDKGATTFCIKTLNIMVFSITTFSITSFSITTKIT